LTAFPTARVQTLGWAKACSASTAHLRGNPNA